MNVNFKWIIKNLPFWLLILIVITLIAGGFEGVINGIILGQFPNLVGKSGTELILFLIKSTVEEILLQRDNNEVSVNHLYDNESKIILRNNASIISIRVRLN